MFSSRKFVVLGLPFKSLIHLELIFVSDLRYRSIFILLSVTIRLIQCQLLRGLFFFFSIEKRWLPWQILIDHNALGFISGLSIISYWLAYLSVLSQYYVVLISTIL